MGNEIDLSGYPSRINSNGNKEYLYLGNWVLSARSIDIHNLTPKDYHTIHKIRIKETYKEHASHEAMIEGVYKFIEIFKKPKEIQADNPARFLAKVHYKPKIEDDYIDSSGEVFETLIRINPLFNKSSKGNVLDYVRKQGGFFPKEIEVFRSILLGKEIHLKKIELIEDPRFDSKSYVYEWDLLG